MLTGTMEQQIGVMERTIAVVNGPNLNLLGHREPEVYGASTLDEILCDLRARASAKGFALWHYQSNVEGDLVTAIQGLAFPGLCQSGGPGAVEGVMINAGAYTHTSVAIRDALLNVRVPVIEVHLSNIFKREEFRHHSFLSDIVTGVICGFGKESYTLALEALLGLVIEDRA